MEDRQTAEAVAMVYDLRIHRQVAGQFLQIVLL